MKPSRTVLAAVLCVAAVLQLPSPASAQLSEAKAAYSAGQLREAAQLFSEAAEATADPFDRARIRTYQAAALFNLGQRTSAREVLQRALGDNPNLILETDFFDDAFMGLFAEVKGELAPPMPSSPASSAAASQASPVSGSLDEIRAQIARAVDAASLQAALVSLRQLEITDPGRILENLQIQMQVLSSLGRTVEALEVRGRLEAVRATVLAAPGTTPMPIEIVLEARQYIREGRLDEAAALMKGVLRVQSTNTQALEVYCEALVAKGDVDQAYDTLKTALGLKETSELQLRLGQVELQRANLIGAREAFRRATELDARNHRAWAALGLIAAEQGDLDTARSALDTAIEQSGTLLAPRVVRAQIALLDGEPAAAVGPLERVVQLQPGSSWAQGWLGVARLALGEDAGALELLREAVRTDPGTFAVPLAEALRRSGAAEEAVAELDRAAADGPEAQLVRARCLIDLGRVADGLVVLEALAGDRPGDARVRYLLGWALHDQRRWDRALEELRAAGDAESPPEDLDTALVTAEASKAAELLMATAQPVP